MYSVNSRVDSYSKWIRQKWYQFFINKKLKKIFYFFTCILPNYVPHDITKEFWKNSHFENMTAGFLHRCQNRLRRNTPEIIHFQTWQKLIFTNIAPWQLLFSLNVVCNVSKWYSDHFWGPWHTQKSIFASMNQYFNGKSSIFFTKVNFDTSEGNQPSYFQTGYIFKILWWFHEA